MRYPWSLQALLYGKPTVGGLMELCEENFTQLMRLAPDIRGMEGRYCSEINGHLDLYLEVLEQTSYTTLLHLTHYFDHEKGATPDPDATLRVYHDSNQVEVLDLRQSALPIKRGIHHPTLEQKWRANMFLSKWLRYCVQQKHRFSALEAEVEYCMDAG